MAGATLGATAVLAANAEAATYIVNSVTDDGTGTCNASPGECTLRDAVITANASGTPDTVDLSGVSGTITLDPGRGVVGISDPGGLTIVGPGQGTLTVSGGDATGIFQIDSGAAAVTISGLTLTDGSATDGGAIVTSSPLTLTNVTISGNTVAGDGGGIAAFGAKYDINVGIEDSTISGNTAGGAGGGIFALGGSLSLAGSTVSGNTSSEGGGGILSLTKYGTTIDGSTISNNIATGGGGLEVAGDLPFGDPGDNPVVVQHSTISGNQGGSDSFGGGLLIAGPLSSPFVLVNSTISGNSAGAGGGVSLGNGGYSPVLSGGSIAFDNSTIARNAATASGGGIYLGQYDTESGNQSATAALDSTIVADNTAGGAPNDLFRPETSTGGGFNDAFSLIENPGNAPLLTSQALITGVDPQLGSLADNGGPTRTMLPSNTSPAIDQGRAQTPLTTDQRREARTVDNARPRPAGGDGTDIGAVELPVIPPDPPPPPPPPPPPQPSPPVVPKPPVVVTTQCKSSRNFTIRLIERRGRLIRSARVLVRGRRVAVVRRRSDRRLVAVVDLRGLPRGTYRVVIRARLRNGDRARWVRSYRTCLDRVLPSSNHLDDPRAL